MLAALSFDCLMAQVPSETRGACDTANIQTTREWTANSERIGVKEEFDLLYKALKDLLFGGKLTACLSVDVSDYGFGVSAVSGIHKHVLSQCLS